MKLVLASASPRRKELLEQMGLSFEVKSADCQENIAFTTPEAYVKELSRKKAAAVHKTGQVTIGSDTIVVANGKLLCKPKDYEDAKRMLRELSGKTHQVFSGYAVMSDKGEIVGADCTKVTFSAMTEDEIRSYLDTGEYIDKAGGYAIQGKAAKFVTGICGSYATVVGLPVHLIYRALKEYQD